MFAQYTPNTPIPTTSRPRSVITPTRLAIAAGLLLGALFTWLWPQLVGLTAVAAWLIGLAVGLLAVGLATVRRPGPSEWGLVFGGQILGVTAVLLLFLTAIS